MNETLRLCALIIDYIDDIDEPTDEEQEIKMLAYRIRQIEELKLWNNIK